MNITFQGKTYDLSDPTQMKAYSAAINKGTATAPSATTQASTAPVSGSTYINVNGAYFKQTPSGPQAVSDQTTLKQLISGAIPSTKQTSLSGTSTAQISPQKALLAAISDVAQSAATIGKPPVSFSEALSLAQKDPDIVAKYADMAKMDTQAFTQQLQQAQNQYSTEAQLQRTQFENERKQLAEQHAAAGTAYSGFRSKAQADLAQSEAGIVTSSRAKQQQFLNQLTSAFESKYGTSATPSASLSLPNPLQGNITPGGLQTAGGGTETLTGQQAGGITGSVAPAQKAETLQSALTSYQTAQFPQI